MLLTERGTAPRVQPEADGEQTERDLGDATGNAKDEVCPEDYSGHPAAEHEQCKAALQSLATDMARRCTDAQGNTGYLMRGQCHAKRKTKKDQGR